MSKYILRLDDACPKRNIKNWDRMEALLDKYQIKPLVGIIPDCKDPDMDCFPEDTCFWTERVPAWQQKGWTMAMHGYQHVFCSNSGGVNPVNPRSEFAGLPLTEQREKIAAGVSVLREHGIDPKIFFAPAHTFDINTLEALRLESNVTLISDTIANDVYYSKGFWFIPQQSGAVRNLPLKTVTFCYHPNVTSESDFIALKNFLCSNKVFSDFNSIIPLKKRTRSIVDNVLSTAYFAFHAMRT